MRSIATPSSVGCASGSGSSAASFSSSDSPSGSSAMWSAAAQSSGGSTTSSPSSLRTSSASSASAGRSVSSTPPVALGDSGNSGSALSTVHRLPTRAITKRAGGSLDDVVERLPILGRAVDLAVFAAMLFGVHAVDFVIADQGQATARVGVVCVARRVVLFVLAVVVGYLLGESLVERFVVLGLNPLIGWVDDLVAVVIADLVGVELLLGLQGIVVEGVTGHGPHVARRG